MSDNGPGLPMQAAGKRSAFFDNDALEHLMTMMLEIAAELWVTRERLYAVEAVLEAQQPGLRAAIEAWEPDDSIRSVLAAKRKAMLDEIFRTLDVERTAPGLLEPAEA